MQEMPEEDDADGQLNPDEQRAYDNMCLAIEVATEQPDAITVAPCPTWDTYLDVRLTLAQIALTNPAARRVIAVPVC